ncbi:hypothetical protein LG324_02990 [Phycicoccus jejuensis]|uniref:hypothetical protein n=1 Tax=Phycicoccus jejuensis TaxID=367299 RepID=UPI00384B5BC1
MRTWIADWGPFLTVAATLGLLAVTFWYARLTKTIAIAAVDSAKSAERAALAAEASASLAEAAFPVGFDVHVLAGFSYGEWYLGGLTIARENVTVFVHTVSAEAVLHQPVDEPDHPVRLEIHGGLPARLEPGHEISGSFPEAERFGYQLAFVLVDVEFSLDLNGPRRQFRARAAPEIVEGLDDMGC